MPREAKQHLLILTEAGNLYHVAPEQLGRAVSSPKKLVARIKQVLAEQRGKALGLAACAYGDYDPRENGNAVIRLEEQAGSKR